MRMRALVLRVVVDEEKACFGVQLSRFRIVGVIYGVDLIKGLKSDHD